MTSKRVGLVVLSFELLHLLIYSWLHSLNGVEGEAVSGLPSTVSLGTSFDLSHAFWMQSQNEMFQLDFRALVGNSGVKQCMGGVRYTFKTPNALIWSFNTAPEPWIGSDCTLTLRSDGILALELTTAASSARVVAWNTPTPGLRVQNLTLQDDGNLVLQDDSGRIVWQSFNYFQHLFLIPAGLRFFQNMTLYDRVPLYTDFSTPGCYAMQMGSQGRLLLLTRANMYVYHSIGITDSTVGSDGAVPDYVVIHQDIEFYSSRGTLMGSIAHNVLKDDPLPNGTDLIGSALFKDGNLMINRPGPGINPNYHLWYYNSSISNYCDFPLVCGEYGLCDEASRSCSCPVGFRISQNKTVCTSQNEATRKCSCPEEFQMLRFKSTCEPFDAAYSLVPINVSFPPQPSSVPVGSDMDCRTLCDRNASCNAALFDFNTSSCALFPILYTLVLPSSDRATGGQVMFLKVTVSNRRDRSKIAIIACTTIVGAALILGVIFLVAWRRWRRPHHIPVQAQERFLQELFKLPPRFSYRDLQVATNNFSRKLGMGGFGSVYEGVLNTPTGIAKVAVKRLDQAGEGSAQFTMDDQFKAEVATIGSVSHVNLVTLKGFCMEKNARLLVFEFMPRGSLDRWLYAGPQLSDHESNSASAGAASGRRSVGASAAEPTHELLNWEKRCSIAVDTAKGLEYLHHQAAEHIVHCDVKPANILLDEDFRAKVGDFGLAKLMGNDSQSFAMTTLKGTRGYLAPEWLQHATITAKSDVYSYGVVLLELITGRRCLDPEYGHLSTWVMKKISVAKGSTTWISVLDLDTKEAALLKDTILNECVPREAVPTGSFQRVLMLALACVQTDPVDRPSMASVVQTLENILEISHSPPFLKPASPYAFPAWSTAASSSESAIWRSGISGVIDAR